MQPTPDLQEFLSALNGFLSRPSAPTDPGYVRFLEIFFRTVKASRGHLLRVSETGVLQSTLSFGLPDGFDAEFNTLHRDNRLQRCPLDAALEKEQAVAIVDLKKESGIPAWFMGLMNQNGFCSLVAVPLMGKASPIGILCAYYEDVCLFDEGTLNHLMMMGRMVGGASEKNMQVASAENFGERERWLDQYLDVLTQQKLGRLDVYNYAVKMVQQGLQVNGVIAGAVTMGTQKSLMAVAAGKGVPEKAFLRDLELTPMVAKLLNQQEWVLNKEGIDLAKLGALRKMIETDDPDITLMARPLTWAGDIRGAIIAWRFGGPVFEKNDFTLLNRMCGVTSLALHAF